MILAQGLAGYWFLRRHNLAVQLSQLTTDRQTGRTMRKSQDILVPTGVQSIREFGNNCEDPSLEGGQHSGCNACLMQVRPNSV